MRIASFNVENLFARPRAMDSEEADAATRERILGAHARVSDLFERPNYAGVEAEILGHLDALGVLNSDEGTFVRLRKLRGSTPAPANERPGHPGRQRPLGLGRMD